MSKEAAQVSSAVPAPEAHGPQPLPLDRASPQFTLRAILTGAVLAFVLASCNVYAGLKIGWGFNMAITAALIAFGGWTVIAKLTGRSRLGLLENNINQTAAAAGASVSSAGLVAPIPALTMLTGQTLEWYWLILWVFSVCMVGIAVAIGLRRQMILVDKLPFVTGVATAETLRELYAKGSEALKRVLALIGAALAAAPLLWATQYKPPLFAQKMPAVAIPGDWRIGGLAAKALTFGLNTTLMMYAVGALIGIRACISLLVGAALAWGVLAPALIHSRHLRLEVTEPLPALPAGVVLPPEPTGYARYDDAKFTLVWKGVMSPAERDELLARSDDPAFREAVAKLSVRSRLELAAPLTALPPGVTLPHDGPLAYDAPGHKLVARRGVDRQTVAELRERSSDSAFRAALAELSGFYQYTTTRRIPVSEPLARLPEGLTVPRNLSAVLRFSAGRDVLTTSGLPDEAALRRWRDQAAELAARRPSLRADCDALLAALDRLRARLTQPPLPADFAVPATLDGVVSYDPATGSLRATGILTPGDSKALLAALPAEDPAYADYRTAVQALVSGSAFKPAEPDFKSVVTWLLWPGVALMVVASLVSFAFSWRSIAATFTGGHKVAADGSPADTGEVTRQWFLAALVVSLVASVILQVWFFEIKWWAAAVGVLLSFLLAVVAGRVSGETNITPVGAMGKVTKLLFGVLTPGRVEPNLMAANVTGGAASQCAELLHDLKCGYLLGATPRLQVWAQVWGALAGSAGGSLVYLLLVPNPREQLITEEWAAPAVAAWKAVAELFQIGFHAIPSGTPLAILIASLAAIFLVVLEKKVPKKVRPFVPSAASLGLAFVIQAYTCFTMFAGALVAWGLTRWCKTWTERFLVTICAGIVAGETLTGVGMSLYEIFKQ